MDVLDRFELTTEVRIRLCEERDVPQLEWFGLFWEHRALIHDAWERHQRGEVVMLVADLGGFPVGQVWIDLRRKASESVGVLWALRVLPPLGGIGLGRRLVSAAEHIVAGAGLREVELAVSEDNPRARSLYERIGYRPAGVEREDFDYHRPDGVLIQASSEHELLRKTVAPPDVAFPIPASAPSRNAPFDA